MPRTTRSRRVKAVAALCAFGLLAVACGDDDDTEAAAEETTTTAAEAEGGEFAEYCDATAELDSQESAPTAEQMEHIKDVRPDEIGEDVDFVADAIIAADGDFGKVFGDPEVEERLTAIEEWEGENCEGGDEVAIPAEAQEYCEKAAELDQQEDFPEAAQLEELRAAAPDEIADNVDVVVDAFIAADGDIGRAFSDPEVESNLEPIEAYEADVCGIGGDDEDEGEDEEEAAKEPLEGAQIIEVSAVDYGFEGIGDSVPAGATSFHMTNDGEAAHEMFMARLGEGVDLDELLASEEEPSPDQAEDVGSTFAAPGESAYLNVEDLTPGTYAVICFIPGPEGKSHYELGMKRTFTVS